MSKQTKSRRGFRKAAADVAVAVVVAPVVLAPALANFVSSSQVGEVAGKGLMWAVENTQKASTDVWIRGLRGVARTNSALAVLGRGTLADGGQGIAGGLKVMSRVTKGASGLAVTAVVAGYGLKAYSDYKTASKVSQEPTVALCSSCQGLLSAAAEAGVDSLTASACPHCGHVEGSSLV